MVWLQRTVGIMASEATTKIAPDPASPQLAEQLPGAREFVTGTLGALLRGKVEVDTGRPVVFAPSGSQRPAQRRHTRARVSDLLERVVTVLCVNTSTRNHGAGDLGRPAPRSGPGDGASTVAAG